MFVNKCILVFLLVCIERQLESAKILGLFPSPSKSHLILGQALLKGLAKAGHEVTMVSPYPLSKPVKNYRDIKMQDLKAIISEKSAESNETILTKHSGNPLKVILSVYELGGMLAKLSLEDEQVHKLLKSNEKFDLIISEIFMNEVFLSFADHFNTHVIAFSTIGASEWTNDLVGNPSPYSYVPEVFLGFTDHMTFFERLINTLATILNECVYNFMHIPYQEELRKQFLPNTKPLAERLNNVSLVLLNSHPSLSNPRPLVPNMIEIGGFHLEPPGPLPPDLQKLLDEAKNGVIYFSLGSNIRSNDLPEHTKKILVDSLSSVKETVLWKWDDDSFPKQYKNIITREWFPQQDILAHPNVKLFITHGGLLSTMEAVSRGVPMIGLPLFADQKLNMIMAQSLGYGLSLDYENLTPESFSSALKEVLSNPRYKEIVKYRSSVLNDRIVKPIDEAIYWVEYVLRHNGAPHLKTARNELKLYQYLLLDIIAFILTVLFIVLLVLYLIIKKLIGLLKPKGKEKTQ